MKHKLSEKQQEILLRRHANQTHLISLPSRPTSALGRAALETLAGLVLGLPLGVWLYYVVITLVYIPIMWFLMFVSWGVNSIFPISASSSQVIERSMNFGPLVDVLLAALAMASSVYFTRITIRKGYRFFAWVQLPLTLSAVLILFYLTLVYHKPMLPFYGR